MTRGRGEHRAACGDRERDGGAVGTHFDRVNKIQSRIKSSNKFHALLEGRMVPVNKAWLVACDMARRATKASGAPRQLLPSWWMDRMTYDWGDALVDNLMGNLGDLTSSRSPYPLYMGGNTVG